MTYKRMLKYKVYPTWVSTRRLKGCKVYIHLVLKGISFYHYQIVCDNDIKYASLVDNIKFDTFEECCAEAEKWIRINN
jgi:hypothetical protein